MKGLRRLTVTLAHDPDPEEPEEIEIARKAKEPRLYTVRLFFAEPERLTPGMRVFDVTLEGKTVLRDFDVVKAAGGPLRTIVREFRDVKVGEKLHITLEPARSAKLRETLLCGIEIIQILSNAEESLKQ